MQNLTQEILSELQLVIGFVRSGSYCQPEVKAGVKFKQSYFSRMAMFWLYGNTGYLLNHNLGELKRCRDGKSEKERLMIALANICVEIDLHAQSSGKALKMIEVERDRQVNNGDTPEHDRFRYKSEELKRFAMHRLTGDISYYPFENHRYVNHAKRRTEVEKLVQAGALIVAHTQLTSTHIYPALSGTLISGKPIEKPLVL